MSKPEFVYVIYIESYAAMRMTDANRIAPRRVARRLLTAGDP